MRSAATRMQKMIDDWLSYSQITTRAMPFVSTNLQDVV
jgi:hypothetical protein